MKVTRLDLCEGVDPMGRGRAKAKQTKVARDLKYRTLETDFSQLQRELHGGESDADATPADEDEADYGYGAPGSAAR
ncbi:hypothetical protein BH24ACT11_BH24ACT11_07030 [soil metagenome]